MQDTEQIRPSKQPLETFSYPWPELPGSAELPVWTGRGFRVGKESCSVLSYRVEYSNWTDELTRFHEDVAQDRHFIDRASRRHALQQVRRFVRGSSPVLLEVGCSSGFLLRDLRASYPQAALIGSDFVRGPLDALAAHMPDVPLLQFDLVQCPLPANSLDAVILLNVLEHIQEHEAAVRQLYRILKPGGVAVLEVPAGPRLYDVYDKVLMHCRRYVLAELCQLTEQAGFHTLKASHLGFFVYPAFAWTKRAGQRLLRESPEVQKAWVADKIKQTKSNPVLHALMAVELALGRVLGYGIGIRCLLTCAKPG